MSPAATFDFVHQSGASTSHLIRIGIHSYDPSLVHVTRQSLANTGKTLEIFIISMAIITAEFKGFISSVYFGQHKLALRIAPSIEKN